DRDDRLAGTGIALHDEGGAGIRMPEIGQQALDDVLDGDRLVVSECLERRELEEVAVLDLRDAAAEQSLGAQRLEDLVERLPVELAVVVAGIGEAVVAVEDAVLPGAMEPADQVRFQVEAGGLVVALVDDDADRLEALVLLGACE